LPSPEPDAGVAARLAAPAEHVLDDAAPAVESGGLVVVEKEMPGGLGKLLPYGGRVQYVVAPPLTWAERRQYDPRGQEVLQDVAPDPPVVEQPVSQHDGGVGWQLVLGESRPRVGVEVPSLDRPDIGRGGLEIAQRGHRVVTRHQAPAVLSDGAVDLHRGGDVVGVLRGNALRRRLARPQGSLLSQLPGRRCARRA
jgi:hypothetical protein